MVDSCECLMFLDTPRSIDRHKLADKTFSAWLYSELTISKFIRTIVPERRKKQRRLLNESSTPAMDSFSVTISHGADLGHLSWLTPAVFVDWARAAQGLSGRPSLDPLYELLPR